MTERERPGASPWPLTNAACSCGRSFHRDRLGPCMPGRCSLTLSICRSLPSAVVCSVHRRWEREFQYARMIPGAACPGLGLRYSCNFLVYRYELCKSSRAARHFREASHETCLRCTSHMSPIRRCRLEATSSRPCSVASAGSNARRSWISGCALSCAPIENTAKRPEALAKIRADADHPQLDVAA